MFFLLQLTRKLTVHNDDDSAMTYVILGTDLCHATVYWDHYVTVGLSINLSVCTEVTLSW